VNQSFADVYNMLGVIFHHQGHFGRAQRALEAALRLNPAYTEAALNLAVMYNDIGRYAEAREVYQAALSRQRAAPNGLDPFVRGKIANMHAEIGDVYASSGLLEEAIDEYRRALGLGPSFVDLRLKLADALRDAGRLDEALAELAAILELKPQFTRARVHLGVALYSAGRREEAIRAWEEALARSPGNRSAEMYLQLMSAAPPAGESEGP
jgi:tetratricopeptide (TPR) repeat protein